MPKAKLALHYADLTDSGRLTSLIYDIAPDEIYHLGAQSHVRVSFDMPEHTGMTTGISATNILEAIRLSGIKTRFYQASSSEMFGTAPAPQNERTPLQPRSPYAAAKAYAYWMTRNYREAYGFFAANGILFNHESPRRGETFVTRKITIGIAAILAGKQETLYLGNLKARRDWGFAPEYVECMWRILQHDCGDDFVIGTGESHSVADFIKEAFAYARLESKKHIRIDPRYFRPTEVDHLKADATKAKKLLDWTPQVTFKDLVRIMVDADLQTAGLKPIGDGLRILKSKKLAWIKK